MSNLRLAVFDCDGTLVDSQHAIAKSMAVAFAKNNLTPPSREAVRRVVGLPLGDAISILAPDAAPEMVDTLRTGYSEEWQNLLKAGELEEPLYPGTLEVIDHLYDAGWLLGVATGKSFQGLLRTLDRFEIRDKFVTLQTNDKVAQGKPAPDMMLAALDESGVDKSNAVMIGDTTFDIHMAGNAGVRAVGVNWGYHEASELLGAGAMCVIDGFHELPSVIDLNAEA